MTCFDRTNLFVGIFAFGGVGTSGGKCTIDWPFLFFNLPSKDFEVGIFDFGGVGMIGGKCTFD